MERNFMQVEIAVPPALAGRFEDQVQAFLGGRHNPMNDAGWSLAGAFRSVHPIDRPLPVPSTLQTVAGGSFIKASAARDHRGVGGRADLVELTDLRAQVHSKVHVGETITLGERGLLGEGHRVLAPPEDVRSHASAPSQPPANAGVHWIKFIHLWSFPDEKTGRVPLGSLMQAISEDASYVGIDALVDYEVQNHVYLLDGYLANGRAPTEQQARDNPRTMRVTMSSTRQSFVDFFLSAQLAAFSLSAKHHWGYMAQFNNLTGPLRTFTHYFNVPSSLSAEAMKSLINTLPLSTYIDTALKISVEPLQPAAYAGLGVIQQ